VVRTRGLLSVELTASTADQEAVGAIGFAIVSDQAEAAGAASIPGPWTDQDWDGWFLWQPWAFTFESITQAGVLLFSREWEIDSKAMRKFDSGNTIVVMAESEVAAVRVATPFRMLFKLA